MIQVQPRKDVLDRADATGPTPKHELEHTRSGIDLLCLGDVDHELWEIDDLAEVRKSVLWSIRL